MCPYPMKGNLDNCVFCSFILSMVSLVHHSEYMFFLCNFAVPSTLSQSSTKLLAWENTLLVSVMRVMTWEHMCDYLAPLYLPWKHTWGDLLEDHTIPRDVSKVRQDQKDTQLTSSLQQPCEQTQLRSAKLKEDHLNPTESSAE